MIEKIYNQKTLYAIIIRGDYRKKKGISFFTDKKSTQQVGFMSYKKNYIIAPHIHKKRLSKITVTTEVLLLQKGILRVDFYSDKKKYIFSKKLYANDLIIMSKGGHGFKVLKDIEMIEVKQGPYTLSMDKVRFDKINEKKIKFK